MEAIVMPTLKHFRGLMGKNKTKHQAVLNLVPMTGPHVNQVDEFQASEEGLEVVHKEVPLGHHTYKWNDLYKIELVQ